jgi:S1-C subfamily serine protease
MRTGLNIHKTWYPRAISKGFRVRLSFWRATRWLLLLTIVVTLPSNAFTQKGADTYGTYRQITAAQAEDDALIGIWSGSLCGKRIVLAVVRNEEQNGYRLKAVLLNGKEVGYGFRDADTWFYVSPLAAPRVYEGTTLYRNRFFKNWYPNRVVLTDENLFTASDDAKNTCGPTTNVYVRKEPRPKPTKEAILRTGSGFLLYGTGFVVTTNHVVDGVSFVSAQFPSGVVYRAQIVSRDTNNDLALLRLLEFTPNNDGMRINLQAKVSPGDRIHALGFPLALVLGQQPSIVSGEVSATTGISDSPTQFRMTAPINAGNSGGPILNENGEVVGIAVASLVGRTVESVNFGIKISTAFPLLQQAGVPVDPQLQPKAKTARELFVEFSKYVVIITVDSSQSKH